MYKPSLKEIYTILFTWLIVFIIFLLACTMNPIQGQTVYKDDAEQIEFFKQELSFIEYMLDSCQCTITNKPKTAHDLRLKLEWIDRTFPYDPENGYYLYYDMVIKIKGDYVVYMKNPSAEL